MFITFLSLNIYAIYVLLVIIYCLMWLKIILVFILFHLKKRPNISRTRDIKHINDEFVSHKHASFENVNGWTGVWMIVMFYQLFGLSFWWHPFTAEWAEWESLHFEHSSLYIVICVVFTPRWIFSSSSGHPIRRWEQIERNLKGDPLLSKWCNAFRSVNMKIIPFPPNK